MRFYRRDLVLLAASVLFTMAGAMYLGPYAIGIGAALFFGMKAIAVRRQQGVERQVGEGLCAECGQRVVGGACPECGGGGGEGGGSARPDPGEGGGKGGDAAAAGEGEGKGGDAAAAGGGKGGDAAAAGGGKGGGGRGGPARV